MGGFTFGLFVLSFAFRAIEIITRIRFEALWMLLMIMAFVGGAGFGIFTANIAVRMYNKFLEKSEKKQE